MAYYIDSAAKDAQTLALGFYSAVPLSEQLFFEGGSFYFNDCTGDNVAFNTNLNINSGIGLPLASGAQPTYPGQFVAADLSQHPGISWANITTAGTGGYWSATNQYNTNHGFTIWPGTATTTFRIIFNGAKVLSTAADRFIIRIGAFQATTGTNVPVGAQYTGAYIEYSDNLNGGNWTYVETQNSVITGSSASSVAFAANTWNRLEMTFKPDNTVLVTLTPCGTSNTQTIYSGPSPTLNAGTPLETVLAGMSVALITKTAIVSVGPVMDYYSINIAATGRQW